MLRRRRLLAAAGTAGLASASGCLGFLSGGAPDPSPLERWTPTPPGDDTAPGARFVDFSGVLARAGNLTDEQVARVRTDRRERAERIRVDPDTVGTVVRAPDLAVYLGSFEAEAVTEALGNANYESAGEYDGYAVFAGGTANEVVAAADGVAVRAGERDRAQAAIDAGNREGQWVEGDAAAGLAATVSRNADRARVWRYPGPVDESAPAEGRVAGAVARGTGLALGAPTAELEFVEVFESADATDRSAVATMLEGVAPFSRYEFGEPSVDGRVVSATGTLPTSDVRFDG